MNENPYRPPGTDESGSPRPKRRRIVTALNVLLVLGIVGIAIAMLLPVVRYTRPAALRNTCSNHLKQIALGLLDYEEVHHALPPAYTTDASGKPLHSWRTLILPYIEEQELYKSIDLTKPWDDPVNAKALSTPVDLYRCPSVSERDNRTTYLAVVTPSSCLRAGEPRSFSDIPDGNSKTLIVVEVDLKHAVPWMAPLDADEGAVLGIGPNSELAHAGGVHAAFVDGHVSFLRDDLTAAQRSALISIAGNDEAAIEDTD